MARNMKRYAEGDIVEGENSNIDDETRARARKYVEDNADMEGSLKFTPKSASPAKSKMVTKEELEKSGMSLRDYLNREQGLTRREGPAMPAKVTDTGSDVARMLARAPKPALRQETYGERSKAMYDEGQRVMAAKRAASAEADAANDRNRQARILTGIKKKSDTNLGMGSTGLKSGGKVKDSMYMSFSKTGKPAGMKPVTKMASGGSASSRGDGIATKGKTRGKMC